LLAPPCAHATEFESICYLRDEHPSSDSLKESLPNKIEATNQVTGDAGNFDALAHTGAAKFPLPTWI
jgi:hypothetical protein